MANYKKQSVEVSPSLEKKKCNHLKYSHNLKLNGEKKIALHFFPDGLGWNLNAHFRQVAYVYAFVFPPPVCICL